MAIQRMDLFNVKQGIGFKIIDGIVPYSDSRDVLYGYFRVTKLIYEPEEVDTLENISATAKQIVFNFCCEKQYDTTVYDFKIVFNEDSKVSEAYLLCNELPDAIVKQIEGILKSSIAFRTLNYPEKIFKDFLLPITQDQINIFNHN